MKAYILIAVNTGTSMKDIVEGRAMSAGLASYDGVTNVDIVHGEYDLVIVVKGEPSTIDKTLLKIRSLPFIRKTVTLLTLMI